MVNKKRQRRGAPHIEHAAKPAAHGHGVGTYLPPETDQSIDNDTDRPGKQSPIDKHEHTAVIHQHCSDKHGNRRTEIRYQTVFLTRHLHTGYDAILLKHIHTSQRQQHREEYGKKQIEKKERNWLTPQHCNMKKQQHSVDRHKKRKENIRDALGHLTQYPVVTGLRLFG